MKKFSLDISKRICAFVLALATVLTLFNFSAPEKSEAAVTTKGYKPKNGMVLRVTTGSKSSDQISYFAIKYYDTSDIVRTHILKPDSETYIEGFTQIHKYLPNTTADKKYSFLKNTGISFQYCLSNANPLAPMTSSYFYFETYFTFKKLIGINFLANYKVNGQNEIDIQEISLYSVDQIYDVDMTGNFANEYYIDFSGRKLMSTEIQRPFVWSQTDTVFDFDSLTYSDKSTVDFGDRFYKANYIDNAEIIREINESAQLTFELNIADVFGAGAEYLNSPVLTNEKANIYQGWLREPLIAEVTFKDKDGVTHIQKIPVVLSSVFKAVSESGNVNDKSIVSGFLQQGEKLVFDGIFLNTKELELNSIVLKYGRELAKTETGFTIDKQLKKGDNDGIQIRSFIVYDSRSLSYTASTASGFLLPEIKGTPIMYFKSFDENGISIPEESTFAVPLGKATGTEVFDDSTAPGKFLITLKTDLPESASTKDTINVVIHYKNVVGEEHDTNVIVVNSAVGNYYGYWPSSGGDGNLAYTIGTQKGSDLSFSVEIPDIDTFLGMKFSLTNGATDDWQCSAIGIFEIREFGKRYVKWEPVKIGSFYSDRRLARDCKLENISPTLKGSFLVEPGTPTYVEFGSGTSVIDDSDVDWEDYKYQMSYEEATQYLGFAKARATYNVEVNVAGDIVNGMLNEDCGSKNQFYFKLVFEDGSSGYVLANQQLTSDGFTSGVSHQFTITTNRDMGNLSAIKILPENQEESEPFDKLKIDSIVVTKSSGEGLALSWKIDVNEWITVDYQDSAAKNSTRGQSGKTENEIAQTFKVTSRGYSLNLMFAIETLSYIDAPFDGKLSAVIDYVDSSGTVQPKKIDDLVGLLCDYAGKPSEIKTFQPVNDQPSFTGTVINRDYLLSPNHTDRFFLSLTDVSRISRIRLTVQSTTAGRWKIGGVSVYRVLSKGNKVLNSNNEYQYNGEVELICQSSSTIPYDIQYFASGNGAGYDILFGENHINVDLSNTWISSITYVPQSNDDSINVYAYMRGDAGDITTYDMKLSATYSLADETTREQTAILKPYREKNMFYAKDIKVSGLRTLGRIGLKADSYDPQFAPCEYVVVEHIRSGVVINTYYLDFGGQDMGTSAYYYYVKPTERPKSERERQTLMFMVSSDSNAAKLISGTSDLAVSINYTSTNDPDGKVLTSPNLFVSNYTSQTIKAGDIITMTFDQNYVKDVMSITFVGQGSVSNCIKIKSARLTTETFDDTGETVYQNFYSFGNEMQGFVTYSPKNMNVTSSTSKNIKLPSGTQKSVGALTIGFTTQSGTSGLPGGTKIKTKIGYYDDFFMPKEMTIDDITSLVTKGSFNPGETANATILVNGISSIRFIEVEPYGNASGTSWALESITTTLSLNSAGVTEERRIGKVISSGAPEMVGFGNIKIQVVAYVSKPDSEAKERRGYSSASDISEGILMYLGNDIECIPTVDGSIDGLTIKCALVAVTASGSQVTSDVTNVVIVKEFEGNEVKSFKFVPKIDGDYRITVASKEIPSIAVDINVCVAEPETPETEPAEEPENPQEEEPSDEPEVEETSEPKQTPESTEEVTP